MKTVKLERSEDLVLKLPEGFAKDGEKVFIREDNGTIVISKPVNVEIDLDDKTFLEIAKMAHEKDITFNEMVIQMLEEKIKNIEEMPIDKED